jgi:integrase
MPTNKLNDVRIRQAKSDAKLNKLVDGDGMYLLIDRNGNKYWRLDYRFGDKRKTLALGTYPEVTIKRAREARAEAKALLREGVDPGEQRKARKIAARIHTSDGTFEAVARDWHQTFAPGWSPSNAQRNLRILELNAFPWIGSRKAGEIGAPELLAVLRRVADRGLLDTAHRLRQVAGMVFRHGIRTGHCERDIAHDLRDALPNKNKRHFAAIVDRQAFGALLRDVWAYQGAFPTACAFKLSVLLALRPGEVRRLEWAEVNFAEKLIRIPIGKMKARREHLIPLSRQVSAILEELETLTGAGKYCFPGLQSRVRPMSENTINAALRRLGYDTQSGQSAHGFRSSFSTLAHGSGLWRSEVVEVQLAHKHGDAVRLAYDRGDFLEERRKLMTWWADECDSMRPGAKVISIKGAA